MKKSLASIAYVLFVFLAASCTDDDEVTSREYPRIKTLPVSDITTSGATFNAEVIFRGNFEVTSYGFVWSLFRTPTLENADKIVINKNLQATSFSIDAKASLGANSSYYVRPFVKTADYTVYGASAEFVSLGSEAPAIERAFPMDIFYLDTLIVQGKNFSYVERNNQVMVGSKIAQVVDASDTTLLIVVPETIDSQNPQLSVSVAGNISQLEEPLHFIAPNITSLSKKNVVYGDTVEVLGAHFGYKPELNTVTIDDEVIVPLETDSTKIKIVLPATPESFSLSITNSVGQTVTSEEITTLQPALNQLSPAEGFYGDEVEIRGENFGYLEEIVEVYFNDHIAEITSFSNESILVKVPEGITNSIETKVVVNGIETTPFSFYYLGPEIDSFSPQNGTWGDEITITGNNFSLEANENTVLVNNVTANVISSSNQEIVLAIPDEVHSKTSGITVEVNGVQVVVDGIFTLKDPIINSINPTLITDIGELITITGENFHPNVNRNTVEYNGLELPIQSASDTEMVFEVSNGLLDNELVSQYIEQPVSISNGIGSTSSASLTLNYETAWSLMSNLNFSSTAGWWTDDNYGYVVLSDRRFYAFNFQSEEWIQLSSFPGSIKNNNRTGCLGVSFGAYSYFGLGASSHPCESNPNAFCKTPWSDFWKYNLASDSWTKLNDAPVSDRGYFGEGNDTKLIIAHLNFSSSGSSYEYDVPSDTWIAKSDITIDETIVTGELFEYNDEIYCSYTKADDGLEIKKYDLISDTWGSVHSTFSPIGPYIDFSFNNGVLAFVKTFDGSSAILLDIETWASNTITLPSGQLSHVPFSNNGFIYFTGTDNWNDPFYKYDPNFTH